MNGDVEIGDMGMTAFIKKDIVWFEITDLGQSILYGFHEERIDALFTDVLFSSHVEKTKLSPIRLHRCGPRSLGKTPCVLDELPTNQLSRLFVIMTLITSKISSKHQVEHEKTVLVVLKSIAKVDYERMVHLR